MRYRPSHLLLLAFAASRSLGAQSQEHSLGIRRAAADYIEGWYSGNGDRMAQTLPLDAGRWIDHLHLVRWRGTWVILNVLWKNRQPAGASRQ